MRLAERELENDLDSHLWLSEKIQNVLIHEYKDTSEYKPHQSFTFISYLLRSSYI
jgi:hypothetical protein